MRQSPNDEAVAWPQQGALAHGARIDIDAPGIGGHFQHQAATVAMQGDMAGGDLGFGHDEVVIVGTADGQHGP